MILYRKPRAAGIRRTAGGGGEGTSEERDGRKRKEEKKIRAHAEGKSRRARTVVLLRQRHIAPSYVIHY